MLLLSDLFVCMGFKLMLIVALNESVRGMEPICQSQRDWVASIRKLLQVRIAQVGWCSTNGAAQLKKYIEKIYLALAQFCFPDLILPSALR